MSTFLFISDVINKFKNLLDKDISFLLRNVWLADPFCCLFSHVEIVTALHHSGFKGDERSWSDWPWSKSAMITPTHVHPSISPLRLAPGSPNCQKRFGHTYLWRLVQLHLRSTWFTKIELRSYRCVNLFLSHLWCVLAYMGTRQQQINKLNL